MITDLLNKAEGLTINEIDDLIKCLQELRREKRTKLNQAKRIKESELSAIRDINDYFENWTGKDKPPLLSKDNIIPGHQFRLSASQMSWVRERFGAAVGSSVVVPYDVELDLNGRAVGFAAQTGVSRYAPKRYLTNFRVFADDAEVFFRQELDEPTTKTDGRTKKAKSAARRKRETALIESLLKI